jgi:hypothetical protein
VGADVEDLLEIGRGHAGDRLAQRLARQEDIAVRVVGRGAGHAQLVRQRQVEEPRRQRPCGLGHITGTPWPVTWKKPTVRQISSEAAPTVPGLAEMSTTGTPGTGQSGTSRPPVWTAALDRQASTLQRDRADMTEPTLPAESTEATEKKDPMDRIDPAEPIERIDPTDPMDRMEPLDPMDRIDPDEPMLWIDPDEPMLSTDPLEPMLWITPDEPADRRDTSLSRMNPL